MTDLITRREAVGGAIALASGSLIAPITTGAAETDKTKQAPKGNVMANSETPIYAYVGCRTTKERNAHGEGINVYEMDPLSGAWKHVQLLGGLENPSYLAFDRTQRNLYTVHGDMQSVSSFAVDQKNGKLTLINTQDCGGKNPVYLIPDLTNRFLLVANYAGGTVATLPINADGSLGALLDLVKLQGEPGPHKTQQASLHPHMVTYDRAERFLLVPDKGGDQVCVFRFDADARKVVPNDPPRVKSREGAGSRHIVLHPTKGFAYLANELDSSIETLTYDVEKGVLKPQQLLPTTPTSFTGNNTAAGIAIAPSGRFVYLSNRGHDSIAIYAVDEVTGLLTSIGWELSGGKGPRFFTLDPSGRLLYAANELSDTVTTFAVDTTTGRLSSTGHVVQTGSPTCVIFKTMAA